VPALVMLPSTLFETAKAALERKVQNAG